MPCLRWPLLPIFLPPWLPGSPTPEQRRLMKALARDNDQLTTDQLGVRESIRPGRVEKAGAEKVREVYRLKRLEGKRSRRNPLEVPARLPRPRQTPPRGCNPYRTKSPPTGGLFSFQAPAGCGTQGAICSGVMNGMASVSPSPLMNSTM